MLYYKDTVPAEEYRKPMLITHCEIIGTITPTTFPICPRCGGYIEVDYQRYCSECGQLLKWNCAKMKLIDNR